LYLFDRFIVIHSSQKPVVTKRVQPAASASEDQIEDQSDGNVRRRKSILRRRSSAQVAVKEEPSAVDPAPPQGRDDDDDSDHLEEEEEDDDVSDEESDIEAEMGTTTTHQAPKEARVRKHMIDDSDWIKYQQRLCRWWTWLAGNVTPLTQLPGECYDGHDDTEHTPKSKDYAIESREALATDVWLEPLAERGADHELGGGFVVPAVLWSALPVPEGCRLVAVGVASARQRWNSC